MTKHVVMWSGGIASFCAAKRVADKFGTKNLILLFANTLMEDEDLYRFNKEASKYIGGQFIELCEGRTPWEVFKDRRFLGNSQVDLCSRILKREILNKWRDNNLNPSTDIIYIGYDWTEEHRYKKLQEYVAPWVYNAPLMEQPFLDKIKQIELCEKIGIQPPRLYKLGFQHNNCGGFCIKAGQASFRLLLKTMPDRYAEHERQEEELRSYLEKDISIMKYRTKENSGKPLTMRKFREQVELNSKDIDPTDWGSCNCLGNSLSSD